MVFSESIRKEVRKKGCYRCCICEETKPLHIHHIIPSKAGGSDIIENAAPLCVLCHDTYGNNENRRKWIKEKRNWWYEKCENRFNRDIDNRVLERLNNIQDMLDTDVQKRNELMMEHYDSLRLDIKKQIDRLSEFVSDLPIKFGMDGIRKLKEINEELSVIKNVNNLLETLSLEYDENFELWKDVSDYLLKIDINQLMMRNNITEREFMKNLSDNLDMHFVDLDLQKEHKTKDINVDISLNSTIAIEIKILQSNASKNVLIGQLYEVMRISNHKFGIGFAVDMTKTKKFTSLNGLYFGQNINIILIVKPYNSNLS